MSSRRFICIHGHFYQPPRENPWLENVEVQDSAYPYHDWNQRITAECYAPNADSRILDDAGRISRIVNNYARISFNFGPTLLGWLETHDPETYAAILDGDRRSLERFGGHGSAMAQVYNHAILPLAAARDRETQVVWGIRDFEHRFGRRPEGMWLSETAVDRRSLELLATHGIRYTILAPSQARRVRPIGGKSWRVVEAETLDTTVPYRVALPGGLEIAVFFYDPVVSRGVAFERLLSSGEQFVERLIGRFPDRAEHAGLVHVATDGETYGHHHKFGDMALAYALDAIDEGSDASLTNYAEFLANHPPRDEVEIVEQSAWSCAHGLGRWSTNCGCASGGHPGWNQSWRAPLRAALDWLRDRLDELYEREAGALLRDPWEARNDYIELVLDRSTPAVTEFIGKWSRGEIDDPRRTRTLELLELQRQSLLMFTSCAWFFDEVSGIETVQNLQYAARAIQLAEKLTGERLEPRFLEKLAEAPSNLAEYGNARAVYENRVLPARVDPAKVAANVAASLLFDDDGARDLARGFELDVERSAVQESGSTRLMLGRLGITSRVTLERRRFDFAFFHLGDHNLFGAVGPGTDDDALRRLAKELGALFEASDFTAILGFIERSFKGRTYTLGTLFRDEQRRILARILESTRRDAEAVQSRLYRDHAPLMRYLRGLDTPAPRELRAAAESVLDAELRRELAADDCDPERVRARLTEADSVGAALDNAGLGFAARSALERLLSRVEADPHDIVLLERTVATARLCSELPFEVDLRRAENRYYRLMHERPRDRPRPDGESEPRRRDELLTELGASLRFVPANSTP